jgi:hypothetical protein
VADIESKILARELGRLGGFGARWVARFLPSVSFETQLELEQSTSVVAKIIEGVLTDIGRHIPELDSDANAGLFNAVIGSGYLNLNPSIICIQLRSLESRTSVSIRAVAKEGAIKQHSARSAVERVKAAILRDAAHN